MSGNIIFPVVVNIDFNVFLTPNHETGQLLQLFIPNSAETGGVKIT